MGYTTDFSGEFKLDKALIEEQAQYLIKFSETRRMARATEPLENARSSKFGNQRATAAVESFPDPVREAVGLPVGPEGAYFVGGEGFGGQDREYSMNSFNVDKDQVKVCIIDYNDPPKGQPGLWCQWIPDTDEEGAYTIIRWDEGEKFYDYIEWLEYIIEHFLEPWGYKLNGTVEWFGEERDDRGLIVVEDNAVTTNFAKVVYE